VTTRVLLLSKALVVGPYQRKAELLAAEHDLDLTVAVPPAWRDAGREQPLERLHLAGYRLVETPIRLPGNFHLHWYPRFARVLDDVAPIVVHVDEEPYNLATFLAVRAARRRGAATLFFTWQNLLRSYPPPFRWFERSVYDRVQGAIAGSDAAAQVLRAKGYRGDLWVIPQFGVDTSVYRPPDAPRPPGALHVGYVGRLVPAKGVDLLLAALARLEAPWRLTVAGDGPERGTLGQMARDLGIAARVTWNGWLAGTELAELYRSLDVLVLPSRSTKRWIEQFGRVLIEAMASRVACVGARSGEIPHVLGDAGLTFPECDPDALATCLARLAADPTERERLAAAGYERAVERFTMERVARDTARVYRAVACGSAPLGASVRP
jgi:glycosyltransferase involved in cell wall biosynthesis